MNSLQRLFEDAEYLFLKIRSGDVWAAMFDRCRNAERPECRPTGLTTVSRCQVMVIAVWLGIKATTDCTRVLRRLLTLHYCTIVAVSATSDTAKLSRYRYLLYCGVG